MEKDLQQNIHQKRLVKLSNERKRILALPPEKALDAIVESPQAMPLVHSFSEQDFYFLIDDIGVHDALPILSMASNRQWEYILDIDVWEKDRIDNNLVTKWIDLLLRADPQRLVKWLIHDKAEFLEHYLYKNIEVRVREHDQSPSDLGEGLFTFDDVHYFRFISYPFEPETTKSFEAQDISEDDKKRLRFEMLANLLKRISDVDPVLFQNILLGSSSVLPAELEEEIYRLRNVRLAEKGFLPFDEAIGIYQPEASPGTSNDPKMPDKNDFYEKTGSHETLSVPLYPAIMIKEDNLFSSALKVIDAQDVLQHIQLEFATLCNQIITADQKIKDGKEELAETVKKACGYINIGIQSLAKEDTPGTHQVASIIQKFPLLRIFKVGFEQALEQKWQAERWHKKSWFAQNGLPLGFWGEEWMGVLGGLLLKKPLFFDNYKTGVIYREFSSITDIRETSHTLDEITAFDNLLGLMQLKIKTNKDIPLTYKNLILTLWARDHLGLPKESKGPASLTLDEFKNIFNNLFTGKQVKEKSGKIDTSMKISFLNWFSSKTGLDDFEITRKTGRILENLFEQIENEYKEVSQEDLDPRYISLFFVEEN